MGLKPRASIDRDRAARAAAVLAPSDPRADEIAAALVAGFFEPRDESLALDIERATAILVGGAGLPALSDGRFKERWGPHQWPRYIELPVAVAHPAAAAAWARALGWSLATVEALLGGELYIDGDGAARLWPWYPEEDATERPLAEARARELGVGLPASLLEDPFEPAWYWQRTGKAALARILGGDGPGDLEIALVPVPDFGGPVRYEGGGEAAPPAAQWADRVHDIAAALARIEDLDDRELALRRLRQVLGHYIEAVRGRPPMPRGRRLLLAGEPPDYSAYDEERPPGPTGVHRVWAVDGGALIACDGAVVVVDDSGAPRRAWPCARIPWHAGGGLALIEGDGDDWHALELQTGTWRSGPLEAESVFGGPLLSATEILFPGAEHHIPDDPMSPDGRYRFNDGGIVRVADGVVVADAEVFGELWEYDDGYDDDEDEDRDASGPPSPVLLGPSDLDIAGVVTTAIAGVTFISRGQSRYQVADSDAIPFALRGDRWRACVRGSFRVGDREVARLGAVTQAACFHPGGERLWALGADHLFRIDWSAARPVVAAVAPLAPIAAAARTAAGRTP